MYATIISELNSVARFVNNNELEECVEFIASRLAGYSFIGLAAGRMGYSLRGFIMRLHHMGFSASMLGDTNVPHIDQFSVVIVNSSSGETKSLVDFARRAKCSGASLVVLSQRPESSIGELADCFVTIPDCSSMQPMKTISEQTSMLLLDSIILSLMSRLGISDSQMMGRHSVFE